MTLVWLLITYGLNLHGPLVGSLAVRIRFALLFGIDGASAESGACCYSSQARPSLLISV